jgi:CBS domain-containing protein
VARRVHKHAEFAHAQALALLDPNVMATTARDLMNSKLLYISDGDRLVLARRQILKFGVTAVPVLDDAHKPVGLVSLRDLSDDEDQIKVSSPVVCVRDTATVQECAKIMTAGDLHHVVVTDESGKAVGMLSALDALRALIGEPPKHPAAFGNI